MYIFIHVYIYIYSLHILYCPHITYIIMILIDCIVFIEENLKNMIHILPLASYRFVFMVRDRPPYPPVYR